MKRAEYQKRVIAGIERLGAHVVERGQGGKHSYMTVSFNGQERLVTMPSTPGDAGRAVKNTLRNVRHALGIVNMRTKGKERIEDMTEETIMEPINMSEPIETRATENVAGLERPTTAARGRVGYYASNKCVLFSFPKEVGKCLPPTPGTLTVSPMGLDTWVIQGGGGKSTLREKKGVNIVTVGGRSAAPDLAYFSSTPAEYVAVDDHVMVRLLEPPPLREVAAAESEQEPPPMPPIVGWQAWRPAEPAPAILEIPTDAECRAALEAMRRVYAGTPYRLVETPDGKLRLQAIIE